MKYKFEELVDTMKLKELLQDFHSLTGIPSTLVRPDGDIIRAKDGSWLAAGWQPICLEFHRKNPETLKRCTKSDTLLANKSIESDELSYYKCRNGLIDAAIPILVSEQHLANLFTGQFFLTPPSRDFFRLQANKYGFNEDDYLSALDNVPVFTKEKVELALRFLSEFATLISQLAFNNLQLDENIKKLEELYQSGLGAKK